MEITAMIKFNNSPDKKKINKKINTRQAQGGFSLIELLVVIAIMVVLVGVTVPMFGSYFHKAKVAKDWANLRSYYTEIQADFIATGEYNPNVMTTDFNYPDSWHQTEIVTLDGQRVKMQDGYFAVAKDAAGNGYQISYYCNKCLSDWDKHSKTCVLVIGATN